MTERQFALIVFIVSVLGIILGTGGWGAVWHNIIGG